MYSFAIIGAGPAGCIALASLPDSVLNKQVLVLDSGCVGGDLARQYGCVLANLTAAEMTRHFQTVPRWSQTPLEVLAKYAPDTCPPLADVCQQLRVLMTPLLAKVTLRTLEVQRIQREDGWVLTTSAGPLKAKKVLLCTGATPKQLDLPLANIPLDVALCEERLKGFVTSGQRVVVFGTAHSGTLVLRNLRNLGCQTTAVYKGPNAFTWARDGDPNGVKQESAVIADEIVGGVWGPLSPALLSAEEMGSVLRACMEAEAVVYAIGFQTRTPPVCGTDGIPLPLHHDIETGKIAEGLWGFGIGFPSGVGRDVGFAAFASHLQVNLQPLLKD
jgi:hypothetical protein